MGAAVVDRTLFVGNLEPRATEELLFELFLQAGPVISVKIPKDKDGKTKQFAFVNFKHEESVPYGMNLLNGIKLFGRPLKIQFRSGSSHVTQDTNNVAYSPQGNGHGIPSNTIPSTANGSRYDRNGDYTTSPKNSSTQAVQRSYSSPDNLQRQAMMNSYLWQQLQSGGGTQILSQSGVTTTTTSSQPQYNQYSQSTSPTASRRYDDSTAQHKNRGFSSHPYQSEGRLHSREQHHRAPESRSHDYDQRREGRWHQSRQ
ncbi:RNA-binding protein 7 isoform X2 [Ascaphus truei]|uniref:RNA-binding protein 7 isoform X2 n=1 Tax=Ascaphus truei TaxID=8439 RepID=UPI003F59BAF7